MGKKKIALIWPNGYDVLESIPLPFGYLVSNTDPAKYELRIFDCTLRNIDADDPQLRNELVNFSPEVVCLSSYSPMFPEAFKIIQMVKSINPKVISLYGGVHASSYPDKVFLHEEIDYIIRGEGEIAFSMFLDELGKKEPNWDVVSGLMYRSNGKIIKNKVEEIQDLDQIKIPDYDAIQLDAYIKAGYRMNSPVKQNAPMMVTRGCPYLCTFCSAPFLDGKIIRRHSQEYLTKWISFLYDKKGIRWFNIIDDNFTFNVKYAKNFCRTMIKLNMKDLCFGTPNGIRMERGDPELWGLMKQAGWRAVVIAPESGSERTLENMKKKLKLENVPRIVQDIRDADLKVQAFIIVGYPGETEEDLTLTENFIKKMKFNWVGIHNFQPLPGTPIYDDLVAQGEIPDGTLPANYTSGELVYVTPALRDFNFSIYTLKIYLHMALKEPLNVFYILSLFSPKLFLKKLSSNLISAFFPKKKRVIY